MSKLWHWLIGVKAAPTWTSGGKWSVEFQSLPGGPWMVLTLIVIVGVAIGIWRLYRRDAGQLPGWTRGLLILLRCAVLSCILVMLWECVLVITVTEQLPSQLLVLTDHSQSMELCDVYPDAEQARTIAAQLASEDESPQTIRKSSRLCLAQAALLQLLPSLSDGREIKWYKFASTIDPLDQDQLTSLTAGGSETALGTAISTALAAHRAQPLAGVVIATDGRVTAGRDPRRAAMEAGKLSVPIYPLAIGSETKPGNARVVGLDVNPVVFVRDPTEISVVVESENLNDQTATLVVEWRPSGGVWEELAHEELLLSDASLLRSSYTLTPSSVGEIEVRARLIDVPGEFTESDNDSLAAIRVIRQRIRVLLVAGYPAPEVQFLRNALLRDLSLEFASWLQSADEEYEQVGHRPLRRLPATFEEVDHYDAIILFDPDMKQLGPTWPDMLKRFVGKGGGGLIYIAGEINAQPLFSTGSGGAAIDRTWLTMLPVAVDPGLYISQAEVQLSSRDLWNLELTRDGEADSIFRFAANASRNQEILASLPGMYWHFPVTRAKTGATVLAQHGDPRMRNSFGRHTLMAHQRFGPGWTVFIGFDSTYRWRYLHEGYFDGFWARLIDRVGRSKALGGQYPFTLATDKSVYRAGDRVLLQIRQADDEIGAGELLQLTSEVELPDGEIVTIELETSESDPTVFEASILAAKAGAYQLRVTPMAAMTTDDTVRPATLDFRVDPPVRELDNPTLDRGLLEDLARASGGEVVSLSDFRRLPSLIKTKRVQRVLQYRDEMWDAPLGWSLVLVALTCEWVLRKWYRLA
jgi:hypothetical protein